MKKFILFLLLASLLLSFAGCHGSVEKKVFELPEGTVVDYGFVMENGLAKEVKNNCGLKVLGNGELKVALTVKAAKFSASAKEAIEAAKGTAETL